MAIKHVSKTPMIPFVFILMVLDASYTTLETWEFLLFYFFLLCAVPPYLWFLYFRTALTHEIAFDNKQVLRFNFKTERFLAVPRYQLQTGDLILLQKEERFPTNIVIFSVIDEDDKPN